LVVVGEGEYTMSEVCHQLESGGSLQDVAGIVYQTENGIVRNPSRHLISDLDRLPLPARHLVDLESYLRPPGTFRGTFVSRATSAMATRGCPYRCIFCAAHNIFGREVRRRSPENVVAEVDHLVNAYGVDHVYFIDDTFTADRNWTLRFCHLLRERNLEVKWGCQVRANTIDSELLAEMKSSGCVWVAVGVESGSARVLRNIKKGTNPDMIRHAFRAIREVGLISNATFVVGSPGEEQEDIEETLLVAREIKADSYNFFFLTPFPGSELYDMALANGWLVEDVDFTTNWDVRHSESPAMEINFTADELKRIRARLQNAFLWRNYFSYLKQWRFMAQIVLALVNAPSSAETTIPHHRKPYKPLTPSNPATATGPGTRSGRNTTPTCWLAVSQHRSKGQ
jgi:anaerobic magnesium-protoporphyrin IX monomethyl ester cyclase